MGQSVLAGETVLQVAWTKALPHKALVFLCFASHPIPLANPDEEAAIAFNCHRNTVANLRERLVEQGLAVALERKPNQKPRQRVCDGETEAKLIALRCGEPPAGQARWPLRLLADKAVELEIVPAISHETVRQVLKKTH